MAILAIFRASRKKNLATLLPPSAVSMCSTAKKSLLTISDSIAIEILNKNALLTGVGNEVHLHDNSKTKVLNIRLKNKVHGIVRGNNLNAGKVLIYGEKEFMILEFDNEYQFKLCFRNELSDWISTGIFFESESCFVLLTAHSVLLEFIENEQTTDGYTLASRVSCEDKSTLYCAHLSGVCWRDLVVFGGNAFGELLIWQPKVSQTTLKTNFMKSALMQRLAAHNGVIFSIDYDCNKQLLISTSDDRSVRFWNVHKTQDWSTALIKPIASGYGHTARVFHGIIFDYENKSFALTVGEDSYFCLWRCDGELLFKQRQQFGAVIWRLAYEADHQIVYTVSSTGNLLAYNVKTVLSKSEPKLEKCITLKNEAVAATEYIAKIKFLTKNQLIGVTNRNHLMLYDLLKTDTWKSVSAAADFKCTVLEVSEKQIAVCGLKNVFVYEFDGDDLKTVFNAELLLSSVIRSFHFLSETKFLISDDAGNCVLLKYDQKTREQITYKIDLPKCKLERWITAAVLLNNDKFMLVSNRQGNLLLYNCENETFELKNVLKHPHGYLGATLLKIIELGNNCAYVQSAGHDSTLKTLKVDFNIAYVSIQSQQHTPVAWIEASIDDAQSYLGFNDNHFVVWSTEHDISLQVACGGGHRCWHFQGYDVEDNNGSQKRVRLAFIKNKKVLFYDYLLYNEQSTNIILPPRNRWHTRPCNILEIITNESKSANECVTTISAGEDNLIKITTLKIEQDGVGVALKERAEIQTHISNIRALRVLRTSPTKCLIFSGGGRAQLCLTELDLMSYRVCEILNFSLKNMDESSTTPNKQAHSFDAEMRVMSIDVLPQKEKNLVNSFEIYTGCSDGYIRKFKASLNKAEFHLEHILFYGKCLLHVRLVADTYLLTAATDGYVTIFNLNLTQTLLKLPLHASGINALDINYNYETKMLRLLTGGDDQAVNFTQIYFKNQATPLLVDKLVLLHLHTAQVTAAKLSADGLYAYTSGVDQNLVHFDLEAKEIVSVSHGCVADVKGVGLSSAQKICLLYGCGLQVFRATS